MHSNSANGLTTRACFSCTAIRITPLRNHNFPGRRSVRRFFPLITAKHRSTIPQTRVYSLGNAAREYGADMSAAEQMHPPARLRQSQGRQGTGGPSTEYAGPEQGRPLSDRRTRWGQHRGQGKGAHGLQWRPQQSRNRKSAAASG